MKPHANGMNGRERQPWGRLGPYPRRCLLALAIMAASAVMGQVTHASPATSAPVTLHFVDADIEAVARTMAAISGRSVVVDPRVKGTINLSTDRPVSPGQALDQFAAALRLHGYALVDTAGLYKIVPEADAKLQGQVVQAGEAAPYGPANQIVTQIFHLSHEAANNLVPVLRPLISPNNTINVNPGTNALVITDYADNLQRIGRIIAALDVAGATDVDVVPLQHALAVDLAPIVSRLVEGGAATGGVSPAGAQAADTAYRTTVVAEPRSNSILIRAANAARLALVRSLVTRLDRPGSAHASGHMHVVYLRNADATSLAATLRAALAASPVGQNAAVAPGPVPAARAAPASGAATLVTERATAPAPGDPAATGGQIQADAATNSLIITAPEPLYRQLRAVIDQLDSRRAQVYVESLIAEVNADKAAEFGIQWQGPLSSAHAGTVGVLGTNFGSEGNNILTNAAAIAQGAYDQVTPPGAGLNLALAQRHRGVYVLGFLARFLQENGEANILSTPNLLTLDNEEARIVIGQNVPFVTGQYTNNNVSDGTVNPFQTIERKDVGLTLRVRPQISENGTIKMAIYQEVSSVVPSSIGSPTGPITNKRTIESTVLVEDGQIVVLGGLLQDEYANSQEKVPGLGDVPLLGGLFRSESRSRRKTNLMVFLRPVVLRDARQTGTFSLDRYELMRTTQQQAQPAPSRVLPVDAAPVMPEPVALPPAPPAATPDDAASAP
jgi:general secretion pathway protein D